MTWDISEMKRLIHRRFLEDAETGAISRLSPDELNQRVREVTVRILRDEGQAVTERTQVALVNAVLSEITGLGPIEPLLQDPEITEIMINGYAQVYVERAGKLYRSETRFDDDAHLMRIITRIVSPLGRRIDEASPLVDARLLDGRR